MHYFKLQKLEFLKKNKLVMWLLIFYHIKILQI